MEHAITVGEVLWVLFIMGVAGLGVAILVAVLAFMASGWNH